MASSNGNCFICGKTAGKIAIKNHIIKDHNIGDEHCYLLKAEGAYDKDYWLFFTVPLDARHCLPWTSFCVRFGVNVAVI